MALVVGKLTVSKCTEPTDMNNLIIKNGTTKPKLPFNVLPCAKCGISMFFNQSKTMGESFTCEGCNCVFCGLCATEIMKVITFDRSPNELKNYCVKCLERIDERNRTSMNPNIIIVGATLPNHLCH